MMDLRSVTSYEGEQDVPADVRRRRRSVKDVMRRMGTPVIVKHRFNTIDVQAGIAVDSPNYESAYGQPRNFDPISHGAGFVSVELSDDEWIVPDGSGIVVSPISPGVGYVQAPKYRGYAEGFLTYAIMPDVGVDFFKLASEGAIIDVQDAKVITGFYPDLNDNDLLIEVSLDRDGILVDTYDRYELKMKAPVTMRGLDRRGRRGDAHATGNRYVVNQVFGMATLPHNSTLFDVEVDR